MKNQNKYKSVSAFAPICNPTHEGCEWGQKNLSRYLGTSEQQKEDWKQYSAVELINQLSSSSASSVEIYVDQGTEDSFLPKGQLRVDELKKACDEKNINCTVNYREGYTHGYWFVQTFVADHIEYHAKRL